MQSKKAISLIVLIITIIVMIILASAIILSLDNANIFNKAEEAVDKTNAKTNKYLSELKLAERELEKIQGASKLTDTNPGTLSGQGTAEEPYLIESIEDLVAFSEAVNNGITYEGELVKLTRLLDFNSDNSYANPESGLKETLTKLDGVGFTSIGTGEYPFKGTFDGDGTEIRNLYINNDKVALIGLFASVTDAEIRNLGITGNIKSTAGDVGTLVAYALSEEKDTYITNCYSKVNITKGSSAFYNVGLVAFAESYTEQNIIIQDCCYSGTIYASHKGNETAGIAGWIQNGVINRCYNKGNIIVNNSLYVAGIISTGQNITVLNSYNEGTIASDASRFIGGIVGGVDYSVIYNSYNAGEIKATNTTSISGGIIADDSDSTSVKNVFNIGLVSEKYELGDFSSNLGTNIYYITERLTPATGKTWEGIAIGKTLAEMKSQAFADELNANIGEHTD